MTVVYTAARYCELCGGLRDRGSRLEHEGHVGGRYVARPCPHAEGDRHRRQVILTREARAGWILTAGRHWPTVEAPVVRVLAIVAKGVSNIGEITKTHLGEDNSKNRMATSSRLSTLAKRGFVVRKDRGEYEVTDLVKQVTPNTVVRYNRALLLLKIERI